MKISIITAALPGSTDYLPELIEDIKSLKELVDLEWVLSFDGSPAPAEFSNYPDVTVYHSGRRGPGVTKQHGLENSSGDWVYPVDCDDRIDPEAFLRTARRLRTTSHQWVATNRAWLLPDGRTKPIKTFYTKENRRIAAGELILYNQLDYPVPHGNSVFFKREAFVRLGGWSSMSIYEDVLAAWLMENDYPGLWLQEQVTLFRLWEKNWSCTEEISMQREHSFQQVYQLLNEHRQKRGQPIVWARGPSKGADGLKEGQRVYQQIIS